MDPAGVDRTLTSPQFRRKSATQAFSTLTLADVTDLTFPVVSGLHYQFWFRGALTSAVSTTGLALAVNGPTLGADGLSMEAIIAVSATSVVNGAVTAYDTPTIGTGSATATPLPWRVHGMFHAGADGTFALRARSEVNGSAANVLMNSCGFLQVV